MKNVAGQPCSTARTRACANAGGVQPGRRVKWGKPFSLSTEHRARCSLDAHIQISVYHQTGFFLVEHLSSKVSFLLAKS